MIRISQSFPPSIVPNSHLSFRTSRGPRRLHHNIIASFARRNFFYPSRRRAARPQARPCDGELPPSVRCPTVELCGFVAVQSSMQPIMVYQWKYLEMFCAGFEGLVGSRMMSRWIPLVMKHILLTCSNSCEPDDVPRQCLLQFVHQSSSILTGWRFEPSEKYEFVSWDDYSQYMEK